MVRNSRLKRVLCGVVLLVTGMLATGCTLGEAAAWLVQTGNRNDTSSGWGVDWGSAWSWDWDWP